MYSEKASELGSIILMEGHGRESRDSFLLPGSMIDIMIRLDPNDAQVIDSREP